jgi:hypothetical protein
MADETNPEALSTTIFILIGGSALAFAAVITFYVLS